MNAHLGCLAAVGQDQEQVLVLRTGTGVSRSYSRRAVARMLHVSLARERQLEREAVSGFRTAVRRGCPPIERLARRGLSAAAGVLAQFERLVPVAAATRAAVPSKGGGRHRAAHKGRQSVSGASTGSAAASHVQQGAIPSSAHSSSSALLWILIGAGILAATAVATPVARRRGRLHPVALAGGLPYAGAPPVHGGPPAGTPPPITPREAAASAPASEATEAAAAAGTAVAGAAGLAAAGAAHRREGQGDRGGNGAIAAYERGDAAGDPEAATNLGVALERRGDLHGALAAYRRADERGDVNGSFNLGCLLADMGDTAGAVAALRRADERGDSAAASNLGVLLERDGDLDGAIAAYRRADEHGDANGAFNLGLLLAGRGDLAGARGAYGRAVERGDGEVEERARAALEELDGHASS